MVGYIEISAPDEKGCNVGGVIHHEFVGNGYGKEAFGAVFDYVFYGLGERKVFVDTRVENAPFLGLMRSLGLLDLASPGVWREGKAKCGDSWTFEFGVLEWELRRKMRLS